MQPRVDADLDVVVVGAGFAGMYAVHRFRGMGMDVRCFESGADVGGTWYWNRYPGARCDVESFSYSYSFDPDLLQEWSWSERYPAQPEILRYAQHVADRFDLRRSITFGTRVTSAVWDDTGTRWRITTATGLTVHAHYLVTAVGCLSTPQIPRFPGLENFTGEVHHTGYWPHDGVDLTGKRVGIFGTGSSGIQAIPEIARQAAHLTVFQRTPAYTLPARNRPLTDEEQQDAKRDYPASRERARNSPSGVDQPRGKVSVFAVSEQERTTVFEGHWQRGGTRFLQAFSDIYGSLEANDLAAAFVRDKIASIVHDPATAAKLTPTDYPIGAKRICLDSGYFETFNRPDVALVDLRTDPVVEFTPTGVRTTSEQHDLDAVVLATGYDAMTGPLLRMGIVGAGGRTLADAWTDGPHTLLGLAVAGFPNLLTITGPGSPSVLAMVIMAIEQHVDWIVGLLDHLAAHHHTRFDVDPDAQEAWDEHVQEVGGSRLYQHANSWYLGANVPGKPRVFMPYAGGLDAYTAKCEAVAADGYQGFVFS